MNMISQGRFRGPARVRADGTDVSTLVAQINTAVTEMRAKYESGMADVVRQEEVGRIDASISQLEAAINAQQETIAALRASGGGAGGNAISAEAREHSAAFNRWFRRGGSGDAENGLRELEVRAALTTQSNPDGGFLVPEEMDTTISRVLSVVSGMRSISRVVTISANEYDVLVSQGGAVAGWVGEEDARSTTGTPSLSRVAINAGEIYAQPSATQRSLDDAAFNVEQWLADEVSITFAEKEGAAFISGDGVKKPKGFLSETTVANNNYAWGKLGFVATGASGAFAAAGADNLMDLYYALKAGYRNGASFVMSDPTLGLVRKFKDTTNNYIWSPPTADMPGTILGKPVVTDDNMPAVAANALAVAFGNFQRGYLIVDRLGTRILRDPFTNKPYVNFYTTKRVGGGVVNFEAIKLLKFA